MIALAYWLIPGFLSSLSFGLPEAIAAAALVGGFLCWRRRLPLPAACCFAVSGLFRETGLLLVACLLVFDVFNRDRKMTAVLASSFVPLFLWRGYVWFRLSPWTAWPLSTTAPETWACHWPACHI